MAKIGAVVVDAVLASMAYVFHLSGLDGSRFQGDCRFWSILAAAAVVLDYLG